MTRELVLSVTKSDLRVDYFRVGGAGGQHRDKTSAGARVTHPPSGAVGTATDSRSRETNRREAFLRMTRDPRFEAWRLKEVARRTGEEARVQAAVERAVRPENLRVEVRDGSGRWVEAAGELS